ncbi:MAG: TerB N-terminal domain-containing protein [Oscillospiraceae bacterium]|nr:TerB N-terminal domain-containing protein [Oscillospiraceae bacterium]
MEDELYTIVLSDHLEEGEKIPQREKTEKTEKTESPVSATPLQKGSVATFRAEWDSAKKIKTTNDFYRKYGPPPSPSTKDIEKRQGALQLVPLPNQTTKKSFYEMALEYAENSHEKTEHIPFLCYWPSYEYMSQPQLDWYFYFRSQLRRGEYIAADLSYIFVYIYELINQVGADGPEDGFVKIVNIWKNYRKAHDKLDRYLIEWTSDYILYYGCDADRAYALLEEQDLLLLMPVDVLMSHYMKRGAKLPIELLARLCDYKFYESAFIKGENENLFAAHLPELFDEIRRVIDQNDQNNQKEGGGFEARFAPYKDIKHTKLPFMRAPFDNKKNVRLPVQLPYEKYKPLRGFVSAVVKEFENALRTIKKFKGRLRGDGLPAEIAEICKKFAEEAAALEKAGPPVEIKLDRERLISLIQDSDDVRKKLIEGSYEYGDVGDGLLDVPPYGDVGDGVLDVPPYGDVGRDDPGAPPPTVPPPAAMDVPSSVALPNLLPMHQKILDFLMEQGGSGSSGELEAAFPGVFVGVEIDRINEAAMESEAIGDLLVGFEDNRWYIIEEYINEIK